jgi:hypothetical protein
MTPDPALAGPAVPPMSHNAAHRARFERTLAFMAASTPPPARILDLGAENTMARRMRAAGYDVQSTEGDLDFHPEAAAAEGVEAVTAFEILEHLVSPMPLLRAAKAPRLFASVPLRLWFASAYRNPDEEWDRHYHEFEDWQFDWLLGKAGWRVVRREKWTPTGAFTLGLRPLLRRVTPRWYVVEAVRVAHTEG